MATTSITVAATALLLLLDSNTVPLPPAPPAQPSGYFVDAPVANVTYECLSDESSGTTDAQGAFTCPQGSAVRFRLGNLTLGEVARIPEDKHIMPQDLVGVDRSDVANADVTAMGKLLQSLDADGNPSNGITIDDATIEALPHERFDPDRVDRYLEEAHVPQEHICSDEEAQEHLQDTLNEVERYQELLDTIRYMDNEERLAYDLYMALYALHKDNGTTLNQLYNIAQKSESKHIEAVEKLAQAYGIEKASTLPAGQYAVEAIQNLYDTLYAQGSASPQKALEVGCMVEVTDINDLNADIAVAQELNATSVVQTYEFLRQGSYNHYWAFDNGLKNMGVTEGCCSLGSEWCHPEYPQNTQGGGNGGHGNGRRPH